jgi:hypothetical protein
MAVTAHFCAFNVQKHLVVESHLIAFRHVEGAHDGENLSNTFIRILEEIRAINRVSNLTCFGVNPSTESCTDWVDYTR